MNKLKVVLGMVFSLSFCGLIGQTQVSNENLLGGGAMEAPAPWTVIDTGSDGPLSYEFNYTGELPRDGNGGCLRVIGNTAGRLEMVVFQQVSLIGGKSYAVDGAIKTNINAAPADFNTQLYISQQVPVEGEKYAPAGDIQLSISTWQGCGPGLDGWLSEVYCQGNGPLFTVPGTVGEEVPVYYAIRILTNRAYDPATDFEILLDELSLVQIDNSLLNGTDNGILNNGDLSITGIDPGLTVSDFEWGLDTPFGATAEVADSSSLTPVDDLAVLDNSMILLLFGNDTTRYQLTVRGKSNENLVLEAFNATIDNTSNIINGLPASLKVSQLATGLLVSEHASYQVKHQSDDTTVTDYLSDIEDTFYAEVTAESGATRQYTLVLNQGASIPSLTISGQDNTVSRFDNQVVTVSDQATLHITATENPLKGSLLLLTPGNSWVFFDNVGPWVVANDLLRHVYVDGAPAKWHGYGEPGLFPTDSNVRLNRYMGGTVLITHPVDYSAVTVYADKNLGGSHLDLANTNLNADNALTPLGDLDNTIESFHLRQGYMATFAQNADGTGYSRVFIADRTDLIVNEMPPELSNNVSFVKVYPWNWARKKGWAGGDPSQEKAPARLNCDWNYNWNANKVSTPGIEYVPMRHNKSWPSWAAVNTTSRVNHSLGFNEPTHENQANMTLDQMIDQWPRMMESGFRLGSPAPADDGLGRLYDFIDRCEELNYRVDFIAMHWYLGNRTPRQMYDRLKSISDRCGGRPLWVTEWNNGAGWTNSQEAVTEEIQEAELPGFLHVLDTASFVERHSIYNWVGDGRRMIRADGTLTPAGVIYQQKESPYFFNRDYEYIPTHVALPGPMKLEASLSEGGVLLSWFDNGNGHTGYIIERSLDGGEFEIIAKTNSPSERSFTDAPGKTGTWMYRVKSYIDDTQASRYSNNAEARTEVILSSDPAFDFMFSIFPNPVGPGKQLNIVSNGTHAIVDAKVLDMSGRVLQDVQGSHLKIIDVSLLTPGTYLLRTLDRNGNQRSNRFVLY